MSRKRTSAALALVTAVAGMTTALMGVGASTAQAAHAAQAGLLPESTISIRVPHPRIEAGDSTRVLGDLHIRGPQDPSGRTVTLEAEAEGQTSFAAVGDVVSGPHGGLSLDVQPTVNTRYRWSYAGADDSRPSRSGVARVVIVTDQHGGHKLTSSLSIRAAHRVVGSDGTDIVRGRLRTHGIGLPHRVVDLLSRTPDQPTWQVVGQDLSDGVGSVQFVVTPTTRTAYRLLFEGAGVFRPSHSGIVRIGVRPAVTATATPDQVNPGDPTAVSGTVTLSGQPLVGAAVDLVARPAGHAGPVHVVGSGTTAADGTVSITDYPTASTVYRLVVRHGDGYPRGASAPVRVKVNGASSLSIRGRHVAAGFIVSGVLRGNHHTVNHAQVDLETLAPDGVTWTVVTSGLSGPHGKVQFLEPSSEGASYRLSYAGGPHLAPCVSGTVVS